MPPYLIEDSGEAPVPPESPLIKHLVRMGLRHAGRDGADADFRHQLDRDGRIGIGVLEVEDQLRQVFDRIDVMMRRRRDELHAGRRITELRDVLVHFVARQLAAFTRLRALRHLDLQFPCIDQVMRRHAEARRGHLLDVAVLGIAVRRAA